MRISIIAALDENGGIGHHGRLPWRLSSDLQRFKALTMGHYLVMGRKTWQAIGRLLPGRTLVIVTRNRELRIPGCFVVHSLTEAIELAASHDEHDLFVIGGGELYAIALPLAHRMYLTRVHTTVPADVYFPGYDSREWQLLESVKIPSGEKDQFPTTYCVYERILPSNSTG